MVDGVGCNAGMEGAFHPDAFDGVVTSCYSCKYFQNENGTVSGNPKCTKFDQLIGGEAIPTIDCPAYASKSCYHAASFHKDYNNDEEFEDDFRGCTPFEITRENYCESRQGFKDSRTVHASQIFIAFFNSFFDRHFSVCETLEVK